MNTIIKGSETRMTNDHSLFRLSLKNRPVQDYRVKHWVSEFSNHRFFLETFPITVTRDNIITDGQHRYTACVELKLPIYYKYSDQLTLDNVADVQVNSKWTVNDVLHSRIQQGNKEYIQLQEFAQANGVSVPIAVLLIGDDKRNASKLNPFTTGTFKAKNVMRGIGISQLLPALKDCGFKSCLERNFMQAVIDIYGQYETERMVDKIEKFGSSILRKQTKKEYYLNNLEQLYNYHTSAKNKVTFVRK